MNKINLIMKGGGPFNMILLVLYIVLKYPIKYYIIYKIFVFLFVLLRLLYKFTCKAIKQYIKFFEMILNPGKINLIVFKLFNVFNVFLAFIDLFIGLIYTFIALIIFIFVGLVTLPLNIIFSL